VLSEASKTTKPAPITYTRRTPAVLAAALIATIALFGLDFWSKQWAVRELARDQVPAPTNVCEVAPWGGTYRARVPSRDVTVIEGFFELSYAENCGAAFGLLNQSNSVGKKILFLGAAIGVSLLLAYMLATGRGGPAFIYAVPLIVSGALGNFVDRVRQGYVVDFFHAFGRGWSYPVFNVADAWIAVGTALLLIDGVLEARAEKRALAEEERESSERLKRAESVVPTEPSDDQRPREDGTANAEV